MSKETKLEKTQSTELSVSNNILDEMGGGNGMDLTPDQVQIPRIRLLQANSGEAKKSDANYVDGAQEGDFLDTVDRSVFNGSKGITISIFGYRFIYIEWEDKGDGSGSLLENHGEDGSVLSECTEEKGRYYRTHPSGENSIIIPTFEYYITIFNEDGSTFDAAMSLSKTSAKVAKKLNTMINRTMAKNSQGNMVPAPIFWKQFKMTSKPEANDQNAWMVFNFEPLGDVIDLDNGQFILGDLMNKHKSFKKMNFVTNEEEADRSSQNPNSEKF